METINTKDITNEALRKMAEENKAKKITLVATLPGDGNVKLYYLPGQEVIDKAGTLLTPADPSFTELKSNIMAQPLTVAALMAKGL